MPIAEEDQHTFLVEHYWPGVTAEEFREAAEKVRASAVQMSGAAARISFLHSTLVPEDEAAFCVFSATSAKLVEDAYQRAGIRYERIVDALELAPSAVIPPPLDTTQSPTKGLS